MCLLLGVLVGSLDRALRLVGLLPALFDRLIDQRVPGIAHELVFATRRRHRSADRSADRNADHSEHEGLVFQHVTESASQPPRLMPRLSTGIGYALPGSLKPVFGDGRRVLRSGHLFLDRARGFGPISPEATAQRK